MRRIVTGNGGDGKSTVIQDGEPPTVFRFGSPDDPHVAAAERISAVPVALPTNTAAVADLWLTDTPPSAEDAAAATDPTDGGGWQVECPPGGTRCKFVTYGPDLFAPMHRTDTLDYDIVLSGSVDLLLEDGSEVTMAAGDFVVIPGVRHAWRAGPEGCTKLVVMSGLATEPGGGHG